MRFYGLIFYFYIGCKILQLLRKGKITKNHYIRTHQTEIKPAKFKDTTLLLTFMDVYSYKIFDIFQCHDSGLPNLHSLSVTVELSEALSRIWFSQTHGGDITGS